MIAQLRPDPRLDILLGRHARGVDFTSDDEGGDDLAVFLVGDADDGHVGHAGVGQETVFDLERVDVLAAADDQVFDAACDRDVAVRADVCFVAGLLADQG